MHTGEIGFGFSVCVCAVFKLNLSLARASWLSSKAVS